MENYSIIILKTVVVPGDWRSFAALERLPHEGYILCILETCGATSWLHASLSQRQPNIQSTTRTDNRPERPGWSSGGDLRWFARKTLLNWKPKVQITRQWERQTPYKANSEEDSQG